ncbi:hypothetical protein Golob_025393, partial [Gossypium lobatum]|nr:hypothetical protein [Gossypium lobatum]
AEDQTLETYIHNLPAPSSPLIKPYLKYARFLHMTLIGKGCKLDPTLISALLEKWRPEMHTFHLPCSECTITLHDVQLQLGRVLEMIYGAWIDIDRLRRNFSGFDEDSTEVQKE